MELAFFRVSAESPGEEVEELNAFLRSRRVLRVERHLVEAGHSSYWTICVEYVAERLSSAKVSSGAAGVTKGKVDYKELLSEDDFRVFSQLRSVRKRIAEQEGVPVYAVATNEQMAEMVRLKVATVGAMRQIEGIGEARIEKYGAALVEVLSAAVNSPPQE